MISTTTKEYHLKNIEIRIVYSLLKIGIHNIFTLVDIKMGKEGLKLPLRIEQRICHEWIQNEHLSLDFLWHIQHQTSIG